MARSRLRGQRGFTLLEVLIAMAIMVMALASILSVESSSINASIRSRQFNTVAMLAKGRMVKLEYEFEGKGFDEFKKEDSGVFPEPFKDYRWKYAVKEIEFPKLGGGGAPSNSADSGTNEATELLTKLVTNFLSKAVREVTLTISWDDRGKESNYSVATYWVDLNHEFSLSE